MNDALGSRSNKPAAEGVFSLCLRFCRCFQRLPVVQTTAGTGSSKRLSDEYPATLIGRRRNRPYWLEILHSTKYIDERSYKTLSAKCTSLRVILPYLRETLEEIKSRKTDAEKDYRVRIVVVGSEIDDPQLIKLIEGCGALVVADRYCYGSFPGRQEIELSDTEDALTQVCRWYLQNTECPRQSALHRVKYRNDHVAQLVKDFNADGAIYEQMKFCTYWSYERVIASQVMPRDYGIQMLSIDRPYISGQSGQLRTRVQAFVESLEIKKLRTAQKEEN